MEQTVVVGSGPAGLTCALYLGRANIRSLVIDGLQPGGQLITTTEVENYPGFPSGITGPDLTDRMRQQAERFGARFAMAEVTGADFSGRPLRLTLSDETTLETAAVVIASGASARYMGLPSEQALMGRGVSACATCDGAFYRDKRVAVIGGGDTAMEEALYLSRLASAVTVIHRRNEFRASKIMADRVKADPKIRIAWDSVVEEVLDVRKKEVTGLRLKNVKTGAVTEEAFDGVFVAIGHQPNSAPFKDWVKTDAAGYIVTENTRTSVAGVFAAGDVQDRVYRQAVTAAGTGCMAALEVQRYLESLGT